MAKPSPIPALKGEDAKILVHKLKAPHASHATKALFRGAMAELIKSETKAKNSPR